MNRCFYVARALLLGLLLAQVLATIQVFLSNAHLYYTIEAMQGVGYLTVPNQRVMQSLNRLGPAFLGGLFFTLSAGVGLSLLSLGAAWLWDRLALRSRIVLALFLILWIAGVIGVNRQGFCTLVTLYFVLVPPVVFGATLKWMPPPTHQRMWLGCVVNLAPLIVLALLWSFHMDNSLFLDFRDNLLLTNTLGKKVNDFYYKYTLYPAEAFKSLDQKVLRACILKGVGHDPIAQRLKKTLLEHDYLPVKEGSAADIEVVRAEGMLAFKQRGKTVLQVTVTDFLSDPGIILKNCSLKSDRYPPFRIFTFFSLLIGFPLALYVFLYALVRFVLCGFLTMKTASVIASLLCFCVGVSLFVVFHHGRVRTIQAKDVFEALESRRRQDRVAALRIMGKKGIEVGDYEVYRGMLESPHVPERYWLAKALGVSRRPETYTDLLTLLDDSHINVVCMAFYALGRRGDKRAVREIKKRIEVSDDWYSQWYAYKALKALGWKQSKSK